MLSPALVEEDSGEFALQVQRGNQTVFLHQHTSGREAIGEYTIGAGAALLRRTPLTYGLPTVLT